METLYILWEKHLIKIEVQAQHSDCNHLLWLKCSSQDLSSSSERNEVVAMVAAAARQAVAPVSWMPSVVSSVAFVTDWTEASLVIALVWIPTAYIAKSAVANFYVCVYGSSNWIAVSQWLCDRSSSDHWSTNWGCSNYRGTHWSSPHYRSSSDGWCTACNNWLVALLVLC